eukprot:6198806-Pleurochrysis_carterae.AAC.1
MSKRSADILLRMHMLVRTYSHSQDTLSTPAVELSTVLLSHGRRSLLHLCCVSILSDEPRAGCSFVLVRPFLCARSPGAAVGRQHRCGRAALFARRACLRGGRARGRGARGAARLVVARGGRAAPVEAALRRGARQRERSRGTSET